MTRFAFDPGEEEPVLLPAMWNAVIGYERRPVGFTPVSATFACIGLRDGKEWWLPVVERDGRTVLAGPRG